MLTNRQLMWFDDGERGSLEDWFASGNRGRPLGRLVALDTQRTRKVGEVTGVDVLDRTLEATQALMSIRDADALLLTYVAVSLLPEKTEWLSRDQVQELMLDGDPATFNACRGLHTVGTDEHGYLYTVVNQFEVGDDGKVAWGKRFMNVVTPRHVRDDPTVKGMVTGIADARRSLKAIREKAREPGEDVLPPDLEDAGVAVAAMRQMSRDGLELKLRYRPSLATVRSLLEAGNVSFYAENGS